MGKPVIYVEPVTAAPWTAGTGTPLGTIRQEGQKRYKVVRLAASQSSDVDFAANGDAVVYSDYSANTVCADMTDIEGGMPAGIIVNGAIDFSANVGKDMWIQTKGPATLSQAVGSGAAGKEFEANSSSTDLTFDLRTTLFYSAGVSIDGSKEAYLTCPD